MQPQRGPTRQHPGPWQHPSRCPPPSSAWLRTALATASGTSPSCRRLSCLRPGLARYWPPCLPLDGASHRCVCCSGPTCWVAWMSMRRPCSPINPCPQVLVRMHYAGVNGGCETFRVRGEHAFAGNRARDWYPLGAEGAGVVAAVGPDVAGLQVCPSPRCQPPPVPSSRHSILWSLTCSCLAVGCWQRG